MMKKSRPLRTVLSHALVLGALTAPLASLACTSLLYRDASGAPYAGRTMELPMELPYNVSYFPTGTQFSSSVAPQPTLTFNAKYDMLTIGMVDPLTKVDKVLQGVNSNGLSFALLAFASSDGPADMVNKTKAALEKQPVLTTALLPLGMLKTPFHYTLHDATGASLVVEFVNGEQRLHDNPIGVMTNGPEFSWHMTNLNNYTFLSNKDHSQLELGGQQFKQPDSGIATVALPASNTSVGRFVRAVYYSQFAEKATSPDQAVKHLAHIMNNFDRPRGITIDERFKSGIANIAAPGVEGEWTYNTEYTSWTALTDLRRQQMHVRTHDGLNFVRFDLAELSKQKTARSMPLKDIPGQVTNGSAVLLGS